MILHTLDFVLLYLDPGTGSLVAQLFIAAVAGFVFYLGIIRNKIRSFINFFFKKTRTKNEGE